MLTLGPLGIQYGGYWWTGHAKDETGIHVLGVGPFGLCLVWPMRLVHAKRERMQAAVDEQARRLSRYVEAHNRRVMETIQTGEVKH